MAGLRKDYVGSGAQNAVEIGDSELRAAAETEARSWSELDADGKIVAIEAKWKAVKAVVEAKLVEIRDANDDRAEDDRRCGDFLCERGGAAEFAAADKGDVEEGCRSAAGEGREMRRASAEKLPRAYVAVESYLKTVGAQFDEKTFEKYFLRDAGNCSPGNERTVAIAVVHEDDGSGRGGGRGGWDRRVEERRACGTSRREAEDEEEIAAEKAAKGSAAVRR